METSKKELISCLKQVQEECKFTATFLDLDVDFIIPNTSEILKKPQITIGDLEANVLTGTKFTKEIQLLTTAKKGTKVNKHYHKNYDKELTVISGKVKIYLDSLDKNVILLPEQSCFIANNTVHSVEALEDSQTISKLIKIE